MRERGKREGVHRATGESERGKEAVVVGVAAALTGGLFMLSGTVVFLFSGFAGCLARRSLSLLPSLSSLAVLSFLELVSRLFCVFSLLLSRALSARFSRVDLGGSQ